MTFKINNYVINTADDIKKFLDKDTIIKFNNIDYLSSIIYGVGYDYSKIDNFKITYPTSCVSKPSYLKQFKDGKFNYEYEKNHANHHRRNINHNMLNLYKYVSIFGTPDMLKIIENYMPQYNFIYTKIYNQRYVGLPYSDYSETIYTPYLLASMFGNIEVMKYLEKEHNWDIEYENPYLIAYEIGQVETMRYFEKEKNWNVRDCSKVDFYLLAIEKCDLDRMKYLENEYNWDLKLSIKSYYEKAYSIAITSGHIEIMKYLDNKKQILIKKYMNEAELAFSKGNLDIIKYLQESSSKNNNLFEEINKLKNKLNSINEVLINKKIV
jgi:sulfur relay (sulfurtransferase) DsrC/TusE family protein